MISRQTVPVTDALDFEAAAWRPDARGAQTVITLPFDVKALFGRSRCPVRVTVNGHTWRTTTQASGGAYHVVVNAVVREAAAIRVGEAVRVSVRKDDAVPAVEVPAELTSRLRADDDAKAAFERMSPSHRREYARWVGEARRPDTRARRAEAAVERIKSASLKSA